MKIIKNTDPDVYIIPTPVGNLEDITERARRILTEVDAVFCEDTRRAKKLLSHLGIQAKLISLHSHNQERRIAQVLDMLRQGRKIAYISDSGTPGISDPGALLVREATEAGFSVSVLPGPTAFVPAVVMSTLRSDRFAFLGFPPASPSNRRKFLRKFADFEYTIVLYESPHRLTKTLADCINIFGDRNCAVVKEISKVHETVIVGKISEIQKYFEENQPRGEFVIVLEGAGKKAGQEPPLPTEEK